MTDHPITPPDALVEQWRHKWTEGHGEFVVYLATQAARWGDDQRLKACCDAIYKHENEPLCGGTAEWLRNAMSPTPPSLKEQALAALKDSSALEALSDD